MNCRKRISALMAIVMLAMQLLLAQHFTVHFSEEAHTVPLQHAPGEHADNGHGNSDHDSPPGGDPDDICQLCMFAKAMASVVAAAAFFFVLARAAVFYATVPHASPAPLSPPDFFSARAPPLTA